MTIDQVIQVKGQICQVARLFGAHIQVLNISSWCKHFNPCTPTFVGFETYYTLDPDNLRLWMTYYH